MDLLKNVTIMVDDEHMISWKLINIYMIGEAASWKPNWLHIDIKKLTIWYKVEKF